MRQTVATEDSSPMLDAVRSCYLLCSRISVLFSLPLYDICDVGRENIPLVAESGAEKITIIHRAVIDYAFLGLIGFYHFKVVSIDWSRSQCQQITINALNIDFKML